jgi:putative spermidine/putrescine transport system substrate-binding protein
MSRYDAIDTPRAALVSPKRGRSYGAALAVVMALSVTACGGTEEDSGSTGGETGADSGPREASVLRVASFGGTHDDVVRELFSDFEKEFNVTIEWEPASATENVAKAAATASNPEFDIIFTEDTNQYSASQQGLLAQVDPELVPLAEDLIPAGEGADNDGVAYGVNPTTMFYNTEVFEENGWDAPDSWEDLFNPDFCGVVGMAHPNVTYTLHAAQMLGGGQTRDIDDGIDKLAELADCARFEPSSATLEEKLQLGEYAIGVHGTIRVGPLSKEYPIVPVYPEEGTVIGTSMVSAIKDSPNPEMAQRFMNHLLKPEIQEQLVARLSYSPTNSTSDAIAEFENAPSLDEVGEWKKADAGLITENRRRWAEQFDRAIAE